MATSTYEYSNRDNLIKIADMYNTDVSTLVYLNPWLKDPIDGHTNLWPSNTVVCQIETEFKNTDSIALSTAAVEDSLSIHILYLNNLVEEYIYKNNVFNRVYNSDIENVLNDKAIKFKLFDSKNNILTYSNGLYVKELKLSYTPKAKKDYLVVPLIGNGNSTAEDYWDALDNSLGLNHETLLSNAIARGLDGDYESNTTKIGGYKTASNTIDLDRYVIDLVESETNNYPIEDVLDNNVEVHTADFIAYTVANEIQNSINSVTNNLSPYKKDYFDKSSNYASTYSLKQYNKKPIGTGFAAYTISGFNGNHAYGKCSIIIDNVILEMPCYPEQVTDGTKANYSKDFPLGRSEPFMIYNSTDQRVIPFTFVMHREMTGNEEEIDRIVKYVESAVYPKYGSNVAAVKTTVKIGNQIAITGVMTSQQTVWSGPIDENGKYKQVTIDFTIEEITGKPKSSKDIRTIGGWRI